MKFYLLLMATIFGVASLATGFMTFADITMGQGERLASYLMGLLQFLISTVALTGFALIEKQTPKS